MSVPQFETTPVWTNYLDLNSDVKPYLQIPVGSVASDTTLQGIVDMSCTWVQNYLGRPIARTEFFRRFSGWSGLSGAYINLPYYPVLQVVSVIEYWGSSGPHTLTEQTPAAQGTQDVYQLDYLHGTVIRAFMGLIQRPWFPGSRNIEITWFAGYNPVPPDIKFATLKLIKHWWNREQQASRTFPLPAGADAGGVMMAMPEQDRLDCMSIIGLYEQQGIG